jgi:membrane protein DedA with SNARE-associated domain/rhodanese-related sulfurtransferase
MALLLELIGQYGIVFVFACVLIEQAGAPVPAYPALFVAGSLSASGHHSAPAFLAAAVLACLIADGLWYAAGKRYGSRVLRVLCRLSLSPDGCVRQTRSVFERWGAPSLIVAKFIPGFASIATAMAGSTGVSRLAFVVYDAIGAALWAAVGLALGWLFADAVEDVLLVLSEMGRWGLMLLAALLATFVASKAWRRHQFRARLRMDRISVHALAQLLDSGATPLVVDVRASTGDRDGRIPGAIVLDGEAWPDDLQAPDENAVVVVYCDCPNEESAAVVARKLMQRGFKQVRPLAGGLSAWRAAGLRLEH